MKLVRIYLKNVEAPIEIECDDVKIVRSSVTGALSGMDWYNAKKIQVEYLPTDSIAAITKENI